jgi:hypothetical protein
VEGEKGEKEKNKVTNSGRKEEMRKTLSTASD